MDKTAHIKYIKSIKEISADHDWHENPLVLFERELKGDFDGLACLFADCGGIPTIDVGEEFDWQDLYMSLFDRVRARLSDDQNVALLQIQDDLDLLQLFKPQLCVELDEKNGSNRWHLDVGFSQGRLLCTYNVMATQAEIDGEIIDIPVGALSRHSTSNSVNKYSADGNYIMPLKHRRPQMSADQLQKVPRILIKGMLSEMEYTSG